MTKVDGFGPSEWLLLKAAFVEMRSISESVSEPAILISERQPISISSFGRYVLRVSELCEWSLACGEVIRTK